MRRFMICLFRFCLRLENIRQWHGFIYYYIWNRSTKFNLLIYLWNIHKKLWGQFEPLYCFRNKSGEIPIALKCLQITSIISTQNVDFTLMILHFYTHCLNNTVPQRPYQHKSGMKYYNPLEIKVKCTNEPLLHWMFAKCQPWLILVCLVLTNLRLDAMFARPIPATTIVTASGSNKLDDPQLCLETGLSSLVKENFYYSLFQQ